MGGDTAVMRRDIELMGGSPPLRKTLIRKVVEVLAEVDDILLTDSSIRYISKRAHTSLCLHRVINTLATNIL